MSRKKTFPCGHSGKGRFCHRCQAAIEQAVTDDGSNGAHATSSNGAHAGGNGKPKRAAEDGESKADKEAWRETFESDPIPLSFDRHPLAMEFRQTEPTARVALFWSGPQFSIEPISPRSLLHARADTIARWEAASGRSAEHLDWYELLGAARYAAVLTRVMGLLESTGVLPGAQAMAFDHTGSQLLERLLAERA